MNNLMQSLPESIRTAPPEKKARVLSLLKEKNRREKKSRLSSSFADFVTEYSIEPSPAPHHQLIIDKLQDVQDGDSKRLMLFLPPGSAKSTYSTILFPPFYMSGNKNKLTICASHAGDLAERFGRKVRNIIADPAYGDVLDVRLKGDSKAAGRFEVDNNAEYYAVGVGGSVTGRRGDLGIIDDPIKGRADADSETVRNKVWEWYKSDFRTRLKPKAAIVIIQTRWHEDDLSGRILPDDYDGRSGPVIARDGEVWEVVNLPMEAIEGDALGRKPGELLWPAWFSHEWVEQEKRSQGPRNWNSLFQQNPTPDDGTLFKRDDFQWYERKPKNLKYYITGDYAVTEDDGDFTEIKVWGVDVRDEIYLVDGFRGQVDSLDVVESLLDLVEKYKPLCTISESGVIRRAIEPLIKKRMRERKVFTRLEWLPTTGDKVAMSRGFQAMTQLGVIHFPVKDWAEALVSQLIKFPAGKFDDGVDACGLLGRYMDKIWKAKKPSKKDKPLSLKGNVPIKGPKISELIESAYEEDYA